MTYIDYLYIFTITGITTVLIISHFFDVKISSTEDTYLTETQNKNEGIISDNTVQNVNTLNRPVVIKKKIIEPDDSIELFFLNSLFERDISIFSKELVNNGNLSESEVAEQMVYLDKLLSFLVDECNRDDLSNDIKEPIAHP